MFVFLRDALLVGLEGVDFRKVRVSVIKVINFDVAIVFVSLRE